MCGEDMIIESLDNKKIKRYLSLHDVKTRREEKLFIVEGWHLVKEAYNVNLLVDLLLLQGEDNIINFSETYVNEKILKRLSSLKTYSKVIGIVKIKDDKEIKGNKVLLLDDIQDPGNLGTIIRSACAFNVSTIVLSKACVDLYNDKVIRSTQGMLFHINVVVKDLVEVITELKEKGFDILGTNVNNGINVRDVKSDCYALIMGNEGHGVKKELQDMCDKNVWIPMNSDCESLNVSVATSIILYELSR